MHKNREAGKRWGPWQEDIEEIAREGGLAAVLGPADEDHGRRGGGARYLLRRLRPLQWYYHLSRRGDGAVLYPSHHRAALGPRRREKKAGEVSGHPNQLGELKPTIHMIKRG
ncbi:hypothetical protein BHE74_00035403 [Ensete ventricosum]|nr:hypothetical protein BHE74_00035403 [Ensete ventricosum]